jgi:hypothetical protein
MTSLQQDWYFDGRSGIIPGQIISNSGIALIDGLYNFGRQKRIEEYW